MTEAGHAADCPPQRLYDLSTTGFLLARLAGSDTQTALQLVSQAQHQLLRSQSQAGSPELHFLRLLESRIQDWLNRSAARAWLDRHWQRLVTPRAAAPVADRLDELPATRRLRRLPFLRQQAALLQRLANLNPEQSASVLGCRTAQVTHPLFSPPRGEESLTPRDLRAYRNRLRAVNRSIDQLPVQVPGEVRRQLAEGLRQAEAERLPTERQVMGHWQQALSRSLMPTGLALLLLLALLAGLLLLA